MNSVLILLTTINLFVSLTLTVYVYYIMKYLHITDKQIFYSLLNKRK